VELVPHLTDQAVRFIILRMDHGRQAMAKSMNVDMSTSRIVV
jgi:hypothetical protein